MNENTVGRPSNYTPELIKDICQRMVEGKSLKTVCKEVDIAYSTVFNWLKDKDKSEFLEQYIRAREERADYLADDILDIADDNTLQADDRRIRIDARKWYAGKLKPKAYGDKIQQEHSGSIGLAGILKELDGSTSDLPTDQE